MMPEWVKEMLRKRILEKPARGEVMSNKMPEFLDKHAQRIRQERIDKERQAWALNHEERAVIEAAKRAKRTLKECVRVTTGGSNEEVNSLVEAVEALEEKESAKA